MKITHITFTGADDNTDLLQMKNLSNEFPFIEWGILLSYNSMGTSRYPSMKTLENISETLLHTNLSLHICGIMAKSIAETGGLFYDGAQIIGKIFRFYSRCQLNFNIKTTQVDIINLGFFIEKCPEIKFILQMNKSNEPFISAIAPYLTRSSRIEILFDASGGRGKELSTIPLPILNIKCGYAGGLSPDNLEKKIKELNNTLPTETEIWLDMETGVRTDDKFDLNKVKQCCEIVAKYY